MNTRNPSQSTITYELRKPDSVSFVMDGGKPFVIQRTEIKLSIGSELHFELVDAIVPFGADKDKSFVKNINNAKSIKEVQSICESWRNV